MWWRALLAAAAISCTCSCVTAKFPPATTPRVDQIKDVMCVLLLSGLRKEDLDANMLKKLKKHNVDVDRMNNKSFQNTCLLNNDTKFRDRIGADIAEPIQNGEDPFIQISASESRNFKLRSKDPATEFPEKIKDYANFSEAKSTKNADFISNNKIMNELLALYNKRNTENQGEMIKIVTDKTKYTVEPNDPTKSDLHDALQNAYINTITNLYKTLVQKKLDDTTELPIEDKNKKVKRAKSHTENESILHNPEEKTLEKNNKYVKKDKIYESKELLYDAPYKSKIVSHVMLNLIELLKNSDYSSEDDIYKGLQKILNKQRKNSNNLDNIHESSNEDQAAIPKLPDKKDLMHLIESLRDQIVDSNESHRNHIARNKRKGSEKPSKLINNNEKKYYSDDEINKGTDNQSRPTNVYSNTNLNDIPDGDKILKKTKKKHTEEQGEQGDSNESKTFLNAESHKTFNVRMANTDVRRLMEILGDINKGKTEDKLESKNSITLEKIFHLLEEIKTQTTEQNPNIITEKSTSYSTNVESLAVSSEPNSLRVNDLEQMNQMLLKYIATNLASTTTLKPDADIIAQKIQEYFENHRNDKKIDWNEDHNITKSDGYLEALEIDENVQNYGGQQDLIMPDTFNNNIKYQNSLVPHEQILNRLSNIETAVKPPPADDFIKNITEKVKTLVLKDLMKNTSPATQAHTSPPATESLLASTTPPAREGSKDMKDVNLILDKLMQIFQRVNTSKENIKDKPEGHSNRSIPTNYLSVNNGITGPTGQPYPPLLKMKNPYDTLTQPYNFPSPYGVYNPFDMPKQAPIQAMSQGAPPEVKPKDTYQIISQNPFRQIPSSYDSKQGPWLNKAKPNGLAIQTDVQDILPIRLKNPHSQVNEIIVVTTKHPMLKYQVDHQNKLEVIKETNNHNEEKEDYVSRGYGNRDDVRIGSEREDFVTNNRNAELENYLKFQMRVPPRVKHVRFIDQNKGKNIQNLERGYRNPKNARLIKLSKQNERLRVAPRKQQAIDGLKRGRVRYDDTHFRNFMKSQLRVNQILEKILAGKDSTSGRPRTVVTM